MLLLAGFFLEENRSRLGLGGLRLEASAQEALLHYDWPGNVRELEHLIGRSTLKALGRHAGARPRVLTLTAQDIGLEPSGRSSTAQDQVELDAVAGSPGPGLRQRVDDFERALIEQTLSRHQHSWAAAARELRVDRANLARMARRHGLSKEPRDKA